MAKTTTEDGSGGFILSEEEKKQLLEGTKQIKEETEKAIKTIEYSMLPKKKNSGTDDITDK